MQSYENIPRRLEDPALGAAGGMVGAAVGLYVVKPLVDLPPGLGPFAYIALVGVGVVLGQLVARGCSGLRPAGRRTVPARLGDEPKQSLQRTAALSRCVVVKVARGRGR